MLEAGDLPTALHHAEHALALNPEDAALCHWAAELALSQLQFDRAIRILHSFQTGQGPFRAIAPVW